VAIEEGKAQIPGGWPPAAGLAHLPFDSRLHSQIGVLQLAINRPSTIGNLH
jgi:hypothetical protein